MLLLLLGGCALISLLGLEPAPEPIHSSAAPSAHAVCIQAPGADPALAGTWAKETSTAVYRVVVQDDVLCFDAWDSGDGEWFEVADLRVRDGAMLVTTTMPSTDWTNEHTFTPAGEELHQVWEGQIPGQANLHVVDVVAP